MSDLIRTGLIAIGFAIGLLIAPNIAVTTHMLLYLGLLFVSLNVLFKEMWSLFDKGKPTPSMGVAKRVPSIDASVD